VECLAAVTQHSHEACQQLLQHTTQQQPASPQQIEQAAAAAAAEASEQQQQVVPSVVQRLLQLMREYDSRLRFQCAACICHLSKGTQQHSTDKVRPAIAFTIHNLYCTWYT
jgi:DNA anti-recombination protein RmuC